MLPSKLINRRDDLWRGIFALFHKYHLGRIMVKSRLPFISSYSIEYSKERGLSNTDSLNNIHRNH